MVTITINTTAAEIAAVCTTAAAAKNYYKDLTAAGMDKAAAREMVKAAAEMVKESNTDKAAAAKIVRAEIDAARAWYRDGRTVMHHVFVGFVKSEEFKTATKGVQFNGNEIDLINKYFPVITSNGRPVRVVSEFVNGVKFRRYRFIDTARPGAFQRLFDGCLQSIKAARTGEYKQIIIPVK